MRAQCTVLSMASTGRWSGQREWRRVTGCLVRSARLAGTLGGLALSGTVLGAGACDSGHSDGANPTPTSTTLDSNTAAAPGASSATTSTDTAPPTNAPSNESTQSSNDPSSGETGQSSPESVSTGADSTGADATGASASDTTPTAPCVEEATIPESNTARLELPFAVFEGETPFAAGADVTLDSGESYVALLLGMFLSAPRLESEDGSLVDAVFVDGEDRPLPYGIFFYYSESPVTSMRLAAPPGTYHALQFQFGAPEGCLAGIRNYPLNPDSEMYWSWGATFLALRLEGRAPIADAGAAGFSFHLGPLPGVPLVTPNVRVAGELTLAAPPAPGPALRLDLNKVLFPHPDEVSLAGHSPFADWLMLNAASGAFELTP